MKIHRLWNKYANCIIAILTIIVNIIIMGVCFDFYYDLNDDVMMKDVMAGVYAGTPDGHNMQTLYGLGAFISLCYKLCRSLPWYGLFLCLCQIGSLFCVGCRLLGLLKKLPAKAAAMVLLTLFIWGVILPHMIAVQYTVSCTMLAASAIFLFMTTKRGLSVKQFVIHNIPSILLVILAYQLRSEMLLLVFPLIGLAGLYRWAEEEEFFRKENYLKYGIVIVCILAGMLVSRTVDYAAYNGAGWRAAVEFFDKRTEVYDFHYDILTSGEHSEYLSSIGLSGASQELLANYNFGLDEGIDEKVMGEIAAYAAENAVDTDAQSFAGQVYKQVRNYIYRTMHMGRGLGDAPYNTLVVLGYVCIFISGLWSAIKSRGNKKSWAFLWELILLGIVRTILWMYIMMRGRDPERITHSLYLAEAMVLLGMFCMRRLHIPVLGEQRLEEQHESRSGQGLEEQHESRSGQRLEGRYESQSRNRAHRSMDGKNSQGWGVIQEQGIAPCVITFTFVCLTALICLGNLSRNFTAVWADAAAREEANRGSDAISQYCRAHPDNFYFEDVYSTVGFSQKIFKNVDNSLTNYDIMGGWMCKTPLYSEKLKRFGISNTQDGLLSGDGVYFIIEIEEHAEDIGNARTAEGIGNTGNAGTAEGVGNTGNAGDIAGNETIYAGTGWLTEYYRDKGFKVSLRLIDLIDNRYAVYQVVEE